jgi:hypothetical protein
MHFGLPEVPEVIVMIAGSCGAARGQPPGGGVRHAAAAARHAAWSRMSSTAV